MYTDHTLTPSEAIRLCALGTLALRPMRYGELAISLRHFVSHVVGQTPEIMGGSIELLKYEGLVQALEGEGDDAVLAITDDGRKEAWTLLTAKVRPANTELNTLIVALKFRFLHLLTPAERDSQTELMVEATRRELSRLEELRRYHADDGRFLLAWIDHHLSVLHTRLGWLQQLRRDLTCEGDGTTGMPNPPVDALQP